jgi:RimJ/RimL family protein N-acetyltransferase
MPKRTILPIENERVILRLLEMGDLPLTLSWRNQDHIRKWFIHTDVIQDEKHYSWFERYRELDNDFVFMILAKDLENQPIGQISLYNINWETGSAEYGRLMIGNPIAQGKGYAKQATMLLLDFALNTLKFKEVFLEVKSDNMSAMAVYKSAGFVTTKSSAGLITMVIIPAQN